MDQTNRPGMTTSQTYQLLTFCARAEGFPAFYEQLACQLEKFTSWVDLPTEAELHGLAPLVRHHLLQTGIPIPTETKQILMGLYLRHRALNKAYEQRLIDVIRLLEQDGIQPILLKGLGLAYQYYPEPALRPATDIDLLVQKNEIPQVQHLLTMAGYNPGFPQPHLGWASREMGANSPSQGGISTHVEIHHYDPASRVYEDLSADQEFAYFDLPSATVSIQGQSIRVPAHLDNLRYLSRHIAHHLPYATKSKPVQLKWSADIINIIEHHADSIDWEFLRKCDPATLARLEVLYSLTPMNPKYENSIPIRPSIPPKGVNQYPCGWPKQVFSQVKRPDSWHFIIQTLKPPSEWWLRMYYGIRHSSVPWFRLIVYPLRMYKMLFFALVRSVKKHT